MAADGQLPPPGGTLRFDGRVAVVTGAGRGLGREFALELARRGAAVVVNDIGVSADANRYIGVANIDPNLARDAEPLKAAQVVVDEIEQLGGRGFANTADVGDPVTAKTIVDDAVREFGRIDIVVNNAGVVIAKPFDELTLDDLAIVHRVHVLGSFNVLRAAWPHFTTSKYGRVVNICSVEGGLLGSPNFVAYGAGKSALIGLTQSLGRAGGAHGVRVNGILPAAATRASALSGKQRAANVDRSAALVAPAVAWLGHEKCEVTGQLFAATAGSMRLVSSRRATGYVAPTDVPLTVEDIRDNWREINDRGVPVR